MRPSLEPFPACCLLGFYLMDFLSPSHPSQPWPGLSRSSPHPFLLWTPSLVFSQFHVPSPFLRFLSTQPQAPFPRPHHSLKPVSLPHPTRSLQNRFLSPHTLSASLYRLILPLQTSGASPVSLPSHSHPSLPTSGSSVLQPPAAPSAHPARLARPVPISPPLGSP